MASLAPGGYRGERYAYALDAVLAPSGNVMDPEHAIRPRRRRERASWRTIFDGRLVIIIWPGAGRRRRFARQS